MSTFWEQFLIAVIRGISEPWSLRLDRPLYLEKSSVKPDLDGSMPETLWNKLRGMNKPQLEDALRNLAKAIREEERRLIVQENHMHLYKAEWWDGRSWYTEIFLAIAENEDQVRVLVEEKCPQQDRQRCGGDSLLIRPLQGPCLIDPYQDVL